MDYLRDCQKLGYDMKEDRILRPRDLGKAHEETAVLVKEKEQKITQGEIQEKSAGSSKICMGR